MSTRAPRDSADDRGSVAGAPARAPAPAREERVSLPEAVRRAFPVLREASDVRPLSGGLLHRSFHVRAGDVEYVLQRVSDVFAPEIHANIAAVTRHLASRGMPTLELLHTVDDEPFADLGELGRWRLMPHLGGVSFDRLQSLEQARSAGALVGRFHAALADFRRPLAPLGIPYRDTPRYLESLRNALETRSEHRLAAEMTPLGRRVLGAFEELGPPPESEARVIHGDLKLSNVLFEGDRPPERDRAFALVDLDTLMRAPLWVELGDAWRSWCNPAREETLEPRFDLDVFDASLEGFAEGLGGGVSRSERSSLVTAPERIALELCARYVTDAFEEVYWGWDESRYASRGDHNAARARGQWRLAEVMRGCREQRREILRRRL